jgi:hypothetical protein
VVPQWFHQLLEPHCLQELLSLIQLLLLLYFQLPELQNCLLRVPLYCQLRHQPRLWQLWPLLQ